MKVKAVFLTALALSSVVIVGIVVYIKETVQDVIRFSESTDFYSPNHFFAYNSKLHDYTAQRRITQKPFIYLTETDHCLPRNLASSSQIGDPETCSCDVIVLSSELSAKITINHTSLICLIRTPSLHQDEMSSFLPHWIEDQDIIITYL